VQLSLPRHCEVVGSSVGAGGVARGVQTPSHTVKQSPPMHHEVVGSSGDADLFAH
jgi:hypothetical protein